MTPIVCATLPMSAMMPAASKTFCPDNWRASAASVLTVANSNRQASGQLDSDLMPTATNVDKKAAASKKVDSQYMHVNNRPVAAGANENFGGAGADIIWRAEYGFWDDVKS